METEAKVISQDKDLEKIALEKESALNFRERRHSDWNDNYILYRDRVITNRLTQRQTINIPLMRYGIGTVMKDIDEPPMLFFNNLGNDEQKEIFYNEYWRVTAEMNKLIIRDRIDKKQACLYGRTFKKLNIQDGKFTFEIIDPQDMLVERHVDPADMDSARCVIQTGIYRTLSDIVNNEAYDKVEREKLELYYKEDTATQEEEENFDNFYKKNQRLADMGLSDVLDPIVGETYIELNEVYRKEYDKDKEENIIILYVIAVTGNGTFKLFKKPLHEVIGETEDNYWYDHFPYSSWGTDPERTDFWSDAPADTLRQPNKALNAWISQLVENRTLRNFNMHYYDSSNAAFVPQTFSPVAWGWYPTPGNPNDLIKDVNVGDLSESLDEMQFVIGIAEKAIAASGSQTGAIEQRQVTLGEVQLALTNAQERVKSIAVFYTESWLDFGHKYIKMLEAANSMLDTLKVSKKGREGRKTYTKDISPKNWLSKAGYSVEVKTKEDKQASDVDALQKLNAVKVAMPNNQPLADIYNKHLLEFAGLSSDEIQQVMDFEKQNAGNDMLQLEGGQPMPQENMPAPMPAMPAQVGA